MDDQTTLIAAGSKFVEKHGLVLFLESVALVVEDMTESIPAVIPRDKDLLALTQELDEIAEGYSHLDA